VPFYLRVSLGRDRERAFLANKAPAISLSAFLSPFPMRRI
jgi:hypothetical protein